MLTGLVYPLFIWGVAKSVLPTAANASPTSPVKGDLDTLREAGVNSTIPADAVTTSASGIDPDIAPQFAELQVGRVAKARGLSEDAVRKLVGQNVQGPALGFLGEPRVKVLLLNTALDKLSS